MRNHPLNHFRNGFRNLRQRCRLHPTQLCWFKSAFNGRSDRGVERRCRRNHRRERLVNVQPVRSHLDRFHPLRSDHHQAGTQRAQDIVILLTHSLLLLVRRTPRRRRRRRWQLPGSLDPSTTSCYTSTPRIDLAQLLALLLNAIRVQLFIVNALPRNLLQRVQDAARRCRIHFRRRCNHPVLGVNLILRLLPTASPGRFQLGARNQQRSGA